MSIKKSRNDDKKYTDEELILQFQKGNERAYLELVNRFKDRLLNFVFGYVHSREIAEDIVQDTFLKLYTSANMYREIAKFSTWIFTIAGNLAKTELRKRNRRRIYSLSDMGFQDKDYDIPSESDVPEKNIDSKYEIKYILQAIHQLDEPFKSTLILRDIQELSYDEMSKIIDVSIGTIKSRINRGRLKLQKILKIKIKE
ncbi:MAG: sigma-70 family RNA polymerase sigma factor [Candidatus Marinimicrobia bacterium]|nr:sigma-70 family RNA polymerase sigma factor [Candidatus Neomarinimicrobiota bacterium]